MGSEVMVSIITDDSVRAQETIAYVERVIGEFEQRFSRFLPDSELAQLNREDGEFRASKELISLLAAAQDWHVKTDGIFDPTVIAALEAFGYDKAFDFSRGPIMENNTLDMAAHEQQFMARIPFSTLRIDTRTNTVHLPHELRIDLGGIGKGYIVDMCADDIAKKHADFWLSAGGDICVSGTNCGEPWSVGAQDPFTPSEDIGHITIEPGTRMALATSGIIKRRGIAGDLAWHHIIDPRTGLSARNDIMSVTVLALTFLQKPYLF